MSIHSAIQTKLPSKNMVGRITGSIKAANPLSDLEIRRNLLIIQGKMTAHGRERINMGVGGTVIDDDAKNVTSQYGCCSSRQMVLIAMRRTHTANKSENPRIRLRRREVGAVNPTNTDGARDDNNK